MENSASQDAIPRTSLQTTGNNNLVRISPQVTLFKMAGTFNVPCVYTTWGAEPPNF